MANDIRYLLVKEFRLLSQVDEPRRHTAAGFIQTTTVKAAHDYPQGKNVLTSSHLSQGAEQSAAALQIQLGAFI